MILFKEWNHNSDSMKEREQSGHQKVWGDPGRQKVGWEGFTTQTPEIRGAAPRTSRRQPSNLVSMNSREQGGALRQSGELTEELFLNQLSRQSAASAPRYTEHKGQNLCLLGWRFTTIPTKTGNYLDKGWCVGVWAERRSTKFHACLYST